jgi:c-di-GMP-binding flagellar brake protein YcgR
MQGGNINRRKQPRVSVARALYIEVVQRGIRSEADNTILRCETLDVSAGGLRLAVPIPIAQGTRLNIAVPMEDWKENLELVGEAKWSGAADNREGYWVGLEFTGSSREDMEKWFEVVTELRSNADSQAATARQPGSAAAVRALSRSSSMRRTDVSQTRHS